MNRKTPKNKSFQERNDMANGFSIEKRVISITGEITANTYQHVLSCMSALTLTKEPITILLNSMGGDVSQGFAIHELIKHCPNPVIVHAIGEVMSIAPIILQAGHHRIMTPLCRFMIHNGTVGYGDSMDLDKLHNMAKNTAMDSEIYYQMLMEKSNVSKAKIKKMCLEETYYTAEQCLEMEFIDEVAPYIP